MNRANLGLNDPIPSGLRKAAPSPHKTTEFFTPLKKARNHPELAGWLRKGGDRPLKGDWLGPVHELPRGLEQWAHERCTKTHLPYISGNANYFLCVRSALSICARIASGGLGAGLRTG